MSQEVTVSVTEGPKVRKNSVSFNARKYIQSMQPDGSPDLKRPWQLILLSAQTKSALDTATATLVSHFKQHPEINLADVAYTLQVDRAGLSHRRMAVCRTCEEAITVLENLDRHRVFTTYQQPISRSVALMFPGLGEHYAGMGQELYQQEAVFRQYVDRGSEFCQTDLGVDLREVIYPDAPAASDAAFSAPIATQAIDLKAMLGRKADPPPAAESPLHQTGFAQPAVFIFEYALAQMLIQWGIRPQILIGHSLGEYVAACVSGVLSLENALRLVTRRAQLIQAHPRGAMLSVALPEAAIQTVLGKHLSLAAVNGSDACVLSGGMNEIDALENQLLEQGIACRRLPTIHAFHSAMLAPLADELTALAKTLPRQPPQIPYVSNLTGTWITAEQATDPTYWARHMCQTVRFADGLQTLFREPEHVVLEVGPGQSGCAFAKQHHDCTQPWAELILPTLSYSYDRQSDLALLLTTLGKMWLAGVEIDWAGFYAREPRKLSDLPIEPVH